MDIRIAKSFFVFVALALFCVPSVVGAASLSRPPNNLGLVGYWSFNDGTGTVATDFSGRGNHGTLTNGPTWTGGKLGGALNFDGVNDYVDVPDADNLDLMDVFTISVWVNPAQTHGGLMLKKYPGAGGGSGWALYDANNTLLFYDGAAFRGTGLTLSNNVWQLITLTRSVAGGNITPYLNGNALSSFAANSMIASTASLFFGIEVVGSAPFNGKIDEVRIYNRALSAGDIAKLYTTGATKLNSQTQQGGNLSSGLVGHWTFDGKYLNSTIATDTSGQGNHGTITGTGTPNNSRPALGRFGQAYLFAGNLINAGNAASTQISSGTASAWIKTSNAGASYRGVLTKQHAYGFFLLDGVLVIYDWGGGANRSASVNLADGQWHHVVETFQSGVADGTILYVDGVAVFTTTMTVSNQTIGIAVGDGGVPTTGQAFNGLIDDARVYNRVLTAQEVKQLYGAGATKFNSNTQQGTNLASGLVGHWTFDGQYLSATTAIDSSGSGNNGALTNGPRPALGRLGQALSFDGTDDYVEVNDADSLDFGSGNFAMTAWFKAPASAKVSFRTILSKGYGPGYWIQSDANGYLAASVTGNIELQGSRDVFDSNWHHVVYTRSGTGSNQAFLYIDGALDATGTSDYSASSGSVLRIGDFPGIGRFWSGSIDDVRIYNRALMAGEIQQLYNLGR